MESDAGDLLLGNCSNLGNRDRSNRRKSTKPKRVSVSTPTETLSSANSDDSSPVNLTAASDAPASPLPCTDSRPSRTVSNSACDRDRDRNLTTLVRSATLRLLKQATRITNARVQDAVIDLEARYAGENRKILGDKIKKRLLRIGCSFDHANNCWLPGPDLDAGLNCADNEHRCASISVSTCTSETRVPDVELHPEISSKLEIEATSMSPAGSNSDVALDDSLLVDVSNLLNQFHTTNSSISVPAIRARLPSCADQKSMSDRIRRRLLMLGYTYDGQSRTYTRPNNNQQQQTSSVSDQKSNNSKSVVRADAPSAASAVQDDAVLAMASSLVRKYANCSVVVTTAGIREELRRAMPSLCSATYDQCERDRLSQLVRSQLTNLGYVHDALSETWQPATTSNTCNDTNAQVQTAAKGRHSTPGATKASSTLPSPVGDAVAVGDQLLAAVNLAPMVEGIVRTWTSEQRLFTVQDVRRTLILADRRYKRCDHTKLTKRISRQLRQLGCRYDATQEKWRLVVLGRFRPLNSSQTVGKSTPKCPSKSPQVNDQNDNHDSAENSTQCGSETLLSEALLTPLIRSAIDRLQAQSQDKNITSPDIIEQLVYIDARYASLDRKVLRNRIGYRLQYKLGYRFDSEGDFWYREALNGAPLPRRTKARLAAKQQQQSTTQLSDTRANESESVKPDECPPEQPAALDLTAASQERMLHSDQHNAVDSSANDDANKSSRKSYSFADYETAVREIALSFADPSSSRRLTIREVANELAGRGMRYHHSKVSDMLKRIGCRFNSSLNIWTMNTDVDADSTTDGDRTTDTNETVRVKKVGTSSSKQANAVREIVQEMDEGQDAITKDKVALALQKRGVEVGSGLLNELLHRAGFAYSEQKRRWVRSDDSSVPTKAYRNRTAVVLNSSSTVNHSEPASPPLSKSCTASDTTKPEPNDANATAPCLVVSSRPLATLNYSTKAVHKAPMFKNLPRQLHNGADNGVAQAALLNTHVSPVSSSSHQVSAPPSAKRARQDANGNSHVNTSPTETKNSLLQEQVSALRRKLAKSSRSSLPTFVESVANSAIRVGLSDDDLD